jgi:hypothetical protein
MSDNNDFFDDVISDELEANELEMTDDEEDDETEDDDVPVDVRTVVMAKEEMIALLGLKTSLRGGIIVRIDPRETHPAAQTYEDGAVATDWFNRSLKTSRRNGWQVIYDGEPLVG